MFGPAVPANQHQPANWGVSAAEPMAPANRAHAVDSGAQRAVAEPIPHAPVEAVPRAPMVPPALAPARPAAMADPTNTWHPAWPDPTSHVPPSTETAPTQRERRTIRSLVVFAGLMVIVAVGVFVFWPSGSPSPRVESAGAAPPEASIEPATEPAVAGLEIEPEPEERVAALEIEPEPAAPEPKTAEPTPTVPEPDEAAPSQLEEPAESGEPAAQEERGEEEQTKPSTSSQRQRSTTKTRAPKVLTIFFAGKTGAKEIRVGRRRFGVDWIARTSLRPGRYSVAWRKDDGDPWHDAGSITIDALTDHFYEVRLEGDRARATAKATR
jgi:hypothetical protein